LAKKCGGWWIIFGDFRKKRYLCAMKNVVDISCFSSGKWLEMRIFDGLMGLFRLGEQTVDSYEYGLETCVYLGVSRNAVKVRCRKVSISKRMQFEMIKIYPK